ncbi:hypothetical protein MVI01_63940 [Myxococcus virescens]|uniref:Uncharacterized protein n=1 Tax=Myxococcus virescens TaxID=83456 RepID=A0A511HM08_9BACT|nr:hypothetical protein MVI01_63940 [Myxococcus virescens]
MPPLNVHQDGSVSADVQTLGTTEESRRLGSTWVELSAGSCWRRCGPEDSSTGSGEGDHLKHPLILDFPSELARSAAHAFSKGNLQMRGWLRGLTAASTEGRFSYHLASVPSAKEEG